MIGVQVIAANLAKSSKRRRRRSIGGGTLDCSAYDSTLITTQTDGLSGVSGFTLFLIFEYRVTNTLRDSGNKIYF